jgi:anti-sigma factor RsiW
VFRILKRFHANPFHRPAKRELGLIEMLHRHVDGTLTEAQDEALMNEIEADPQAAAIALNFYRDEMVFRSFFKSLQEKDPQTPTAAHA